MKIAIIGAGSVGKTLGRVLEAKGHDIAYGTRDPAKAAVRHAKTVVQALAGAEAAILATPWVASEAVVCEFADELAGKIVIDATNPINPTLTRLAVGFNTSGAELPGARGEILQSAQHHGHRRDGKAALRRGRRRHVRRRPRRRRQESRAAHCRGRRVRRCRRRRAQGRAAAGTACHVMGPARAEGARGRFRLDHGAPRCRKPKCQAAR